MIRDTDIIGRIRQGDVKQFESLFRSSYVSLVRYAKTLLKDQDATDACIS